MPVMSTGLGSAVGRNTVCFGTDDCSVWLHLGLGLGVLLGSNKPEPPKGCCSRRSNVCMSFFCGLGLETVSPAVLDWPYTHRSVF